MLIFPGPLFFTIPISAFPMRCFPRCIACMIIRWTGTPRSRALGGLRITHYGRFGRREKVGTGFGSFDNVLLHFGNEPSVGLRVWRGAIDWNVVIVAHFCSRRHLGLALAFDFLAQLLFRFRFLQYLYDTPSNNFK